MPTQITLQDDECALVISAPDKATAYVPEIKDENAKAPQSMVLTAALLVAIKNQNPHITAIIGNFMKDAEYTRPEGENHGKEN